MKLRVWTVLAAAAFVGCGKGQSVSKEANAGAGICVRCHGGADNQTGAPPNDVRGENRTASLSVGAHSAHVQAGPFARAFDCDACHPKPASLTTPTHPNGKVDVVWGDLATHTGQIAPSFDASTGKCSNVWCHGDFRGGNTSNAPAWTAVGTGAAACGTCHLAPPTANGHPQRDDCGSCHGGYTKTTVNVATHVDGRVDVLDLACTACHGDAGRGSTTLNPALAAAPPADTDGNTVSGKVGAHQKHLLGGDLRAPLACTECHAVPQSLDGHPNGTTGFAWGALATGNHSTTPVYENRTCSSTYCHGATLNAGGTNHSPSWTGGAADAACGTCHGAPPPSPHVQNSSCGSCHGTAYTYNPTTHTGTVDPALHVNGQPDVVGLTCSSCHGTTGRTATTTNPQLAAAPPTDADGASSSAKVGAHLSHLLGGALRAELPCSSCHVVPTRLGHATGTAELQFDALATASGALQARYTGGSCQATYCHGVTLAGGSVTQPVWNQLDGTQAACGSCHGTPPATFRGPNGPVRHTSSTKCEGCHPGYTRVSANPATHVDGTVQVSFDCSSCHGDRTRQPTPTNPNLPAAPPSDTNGASDATLPGVGAHQAHLRDGKLRGAMACTECHAIPASTDPHPTGTTEFVWGPLAVGTNTVGGMVTPSYDRTAHTCSNVYCHGANLNLGGTNTTPSWVGGSAEVACGTCHLSPPVTLSGGGSHPHSKNCNGCHGRGAGYDVDAQTADTTTHVDGHLDVNQMTCTSCHGDSARTATHDAPLYAAPPVDTWGEFVSSRVGAHQPHLTDGGLRSALACTECHPVPSSTSHSNGVTDFVWGPLAVTSMNGGPAVPSYDRNTGRCSGTYCHGANLNGGGSNHAPTWSQGPAAATCDSCHGAPPATLPNGTSPHPRNVNCGSCHGTAYTYNPTTHGGTVDPAQHVNGHVDVGAMTCTSCHGTAGQTATPAAPLYAAPPVDTTGATDSQAVGKHQQHLAATWGVPVACAQCHTVPPNLDSHPSGTTAFGWGSLATGANSNALNSGAQLGPWQFGNFRGPTTPSYTGGSCSAVYCHGAYTGDFGYWPNGSDVNDPSQVVTITFSGKAALDPSYTVSWAPGTTVTCGSCHFGGTSTPPSGLPTWHSGLHGWGPGRYYNDCQYCHPDASGSNGLGTTITDPSKHIDGTIQVVPRFQSCSGNCHQNG